MFAVFSANQLGANPQEGFKFQFDTVDAAAATITVLADEIGIVVGSTFEVGKPFSVVTSLTNCLTALRDNDTIKAATNFLFAIATSPSKLDVTVSKDTVHPTLLESQVGIIVGSTFQNAGNSSVTARVKRAIELISETTLKG